MATLAPQACAGCAEHRTQSLIRLGLSPDRWDVLVALAGNPNVGKSTVFNALTGLRQHTGNWPGKTVVRAEGVVAHEGKRVKVVDLPGTYSLQAGSEDEEVARDFILFGRPDVTVVVVDATRLERNLNLVLQILDITDRVVVYLNLIDEARRHGIAIDAGKLERTLGVPVVPGIARSGVGIEELLAAASRVAAREGAPPKPYRVERHAPDVEAAVSALAPAVEQVFPGVPNARWVAMRLLNADEAVMEAVRSGELGQLGEDVETPEGFPPVVDRARVLDTARRLRWELPGDFHDSIMERTYAEAQRIAEVVQKRGLKRAGFDLDRTLDRLLTSRVFGFPLMLAILAVVFWLTIEGSNVPSGMLATLLIDTVHPWLAGIGESLSMPWWLSGFLFDGVYLATAWVVSVMLPPMAIFFPLFTLLEDFGYLPRVAFNLDALFRKAGAHGKQALTMCMGFGCNAAGVVATRVIDSPRERLIAIITNNFSLCNGRWPTQILIATIFVGAVAPAGIAGLVSAGAVVGIALLGIAMMFLASWGLSRTVLRGEATSFSLELPPYRPPRVLQTLYTSLIDRTLIVLWRAVVFAMPAGAVIWLMSNIHVGGASLAELAVGGLDPFGLLLGLNGVILLAYVVAIPANEIVIPNVLMLTVLTAGIAGAGGGAGVMFELDSVSATGDLLRAGGWTLLTAVNLMLFSLLHNPCSTTIYTIYKETRSAKWTTVAALLPLAMGFTVCFLVAQVWRLVAV
ncbi:MAG TPA: ferrous iron transport protein B [Longimicrobiales bacterium]|nr:ferrous iron transport protein B [Longimicrobiales bacterium]